VPGYANPFGLYNFEADCLLTFFSSAIPTVPNGGNHTPAFTAAAGTIAAHEAAMNITKGLAVTTYRVLTDSDFFSKVQSFKSFLRDSGVFVQS
jgi:hypothetical protein